MKSILITNPKGGCGKTTIATNLAAAFANWGLKTALVDTDRQLSSLQWLDTRPQTAAPILGLDCSKRPKKLPRGIARLVIDSAAGLPLREVRELVRLADIVIIPLLPSAFDIKATMTFLEKFTDLKPIRKRKKPFSLMRNRCRVGSRAVKRLDDVMIDVDAVDVGWLPERSLYNEVAWQGLGIFDLQTHQSHEIQGDWIPIVRFIENDGVAFETISGEAAA